MKTDINIKEEWKKSIHGEVFFHDNSIKNKGGLWKDEFIERNNPESKLQDIFHKYINQSLPKNIILDVGAGPFTTVNKKSDFTEIEIHAVDPLADEYDESLERYGVKPLLRTEKLDGEELTKKFELNTFDITYSRNAIDHSYNPLQIIEEMIKVTKLNGYIILQVIMKEGSGSGWEGLHNWDFYIKEYRNEKWGFNTYNPILKGKNTDEIDIAELFKDVAKIIELRIEVRLLTLVFKKK